MYLTAFINHYDFQQACRRNVGCIIIFRPLELLNIKLAACFWRLLVLGKPKLLHGLPWNDPKVGVDNTKRLA